MDGLLFQRLDANTKRAVENIRDTADNIWKRPLHRFYTDHTVTHSDRIVAHLDGLTTGILASARPLTQIEIYILLCAAYLHDIGMQNERFAGGDLEQIRDQHNDQSAEMIYAAFEKTANALNIPLLSDPTLVEAVALVSRGHRKVDLHAEEYESLAYGSEMVRLRCLAALLRFADELDIDHRRINLEQLKLLALPVDSQLHWWKCHYVGGVNIEDESIQIHYRFPENRQDYKDIIGPLVENEIRSKLAALEPMFRANSIKAALASSRVRFLRTVTSLPAGVEDLAKQKVAAKATPKSGPDSQANKALTSITKLRVTINRDFEGFDRNSEVELVNTLASRLGIQAQVIQVLSVEAGSVVITMSMPQVAAKHLQSLFERADHQIADLRIVSVSIADETSSDQQGGVTALHQFPAPPADFTGRANELESLRARVAGASSAGAAIFGLRGQGGVGKTALALVLAHELKAHYPDAQLYVDLRGADEQAPVTPEDALAGFIRAFEPTAKLPEARAELQAIYRSLLDGKRALVLLDNARDAAQVTPLLPPPGCLVLVTSRQHFALPGLFARNLDSLPRPDSIALLLTLAPRTGDHTDAIARACGDLPLALRLAGSALAERPNLTPEGYLARLNDEGRRFKELDAVSAALALSAALLPPDLQGKWRALSVFPADFDWRGAAFVWKGEVKEADEADSTDALGELMRYSLLDYDEKASRYSLHDLARAWAVGRLDEATRETARLRHATYYMQAASAADDQYKKGGGAILQGLALFDREWTNIRAGQAWAAECAAQTDGIARLAMRYALWAPYITNLRLHAREQIAWLEAARKAAITIGDRRGEGNALGSLGIAYADLGETRRAIEHYEQWLAITREIGDRRGEGAALGNLGLAYAALGETRRAIEHYEQDLVIMRAIGDRRGEGAALGNLGIAYADLGETRRAIEHYEQHLTIAREIGDRRSEGQALGNLGIAYKNLGEPRRAIEFHEQARVIDREIGDRRGEGQDLGNLGLAYVDLGETRRAIEFYEKWLAITRAIGDRRGEGAALGNLGNAYADLGETRRAIEHYERHLAITREIGDPRGEGNALWNTSLALDKLGDRLAAIEYAEKALAIRLQIEDPKVEKVRRKLAQWRGEAPA